MLQHHLAIKCGFSVCVFCVKFVPSGFYCYSDVHIAADEPPVCVSVCGLLLICVFNVLIQVFIANKMYNLLGSVNLGK